MTYDVRKEYFDWLRARIFSGAHWWVDPYNKLIGWLMDREFDYSMGMDGNRFTDGEELRYRFGAEKGYAPALVAGELDDRPCSMLEMMTALALRCEEDIMQDPYKGVNASRWFWAMIESLGLHTMTDDRFDSVRAEEVITRFVNREYDPCGEGGLFTLKHPLRDMRSVDIWTQAMWYLTEQWKENRIP